MIGGIVLAAVLGATAVASVALLPPLHPAQLWSIPWAIATVLYSLNLLPYRPLSALTVTIASLATIAFVLLSLVGDRAWGTRIHEPPRAPQQDPRIRIAAVIAAALTALWLSAYLVQAIAEVGVRDTIVSSRALRDAIGAGELSLTIKYLYAALAATCLCAAAAAQAGSERERLRWALASVACCGTIYFNTGRSTIAVAAVAGLIAYFLFRDRPLRRASFVAAIAGTLALTLAVFIGVGALIGKTYGNNEELQSLDTVFSRNAAVSWLALPYQYASAPVAGLDAQVDTSAAVGGAFGCAAAPPACDGLRAAGFDAPALERVRPFTAPPLRWNTFTALDVPLIDLGRLPTVPLFGLLGLAMGALWAAARAGSVAGGLSYSLLSPALFGSFTTFNFTAPHIVGSLIIALALLWLAGRMVGASMAGRHIGETSTESQPSGFTAVE